MFCLHATLVSYFWFIFLSSLFFFYGYGQLPYFTPTCFPFSMISVNVCYSLIIVSNVEISYFISYFGKFLLRWSSVNFSACKLVKHTWSIFPLLYLFLNLSPWLHWDCVLKIIMVHVQQSAFLVVYQSLIIDLYLSLLTFDSTYCNFNKYEKKKKKKKISFCFSQSSLNALFSFRA